MRMCDLAESVLLSRSGLTRLIDRLEREGLVARHSCQQDARGAYAGLTEAGRAKLAAVRPTHLAGVRAHFLAHFDEDEMDRWPATGSACSRAPPAADVPAPPFRRRLRGAADRSVLSRRSVEVIGRAAWREARVASEELVAARP